jgi:putative transposase
MSNYRHREQPGRTLFFTVVSFDRRPHLATTTARPILRKALIETCRERPFQTLAQVLLPDHIHAIWTMPPDDGDFSLRWRLIKTRVTQALREAGMDVTNPRPSRRERHDHAVWQPRFWEHVIRDDDDLRRHVEYIHWNPVKHGLVERVRDWPWSTFHRYVREGLYPADWGSSEPPKLADLTDEEE